MDLFDQNKVQFEKVLLRQTLIGLTYEEAKAASKYHTIRAVTIDGVNQLLNDFFYFNKFDVVIENNKIISVN